MTKKIDLSGYLNEFSLEYFWEADGIPEHVAAKVILAAEQTFSPDDWQRMVIESSDRPYTASDELDLIRKLCNFVDLVRKDPFYDRQSPFYAGDDEYWRKYWNSCPPIGAT